MRTGVCVAIIVGLLSLSATGQETVAGEWMLTLDDQFGPNIMRLSLVVAGEKLTGTAGNRSIEGTVRGATIQFKGGNLTASGSLEGAALNGEALFPDRTVKWTAVRDAAAARQHRRRTISNRPSFTCIFLRKSPRCSAFIRETPCERGASMRAAATSRAIGVQPAAIRRPAPSMSKAPCRTTRSSSGSTACARTATGRKAATPSCGMRWSRERSGI